MDEALAIFQALADPTRFAVFQCIRRCGGKTAYDTEKGCCDATEPNGVALCDVKCQLPCAPSTLTHHLNVLRDAGIIETERHGRQVYVQLNTARLIQLSGFLLNVK